MSKLNKLLTALEEGKRPTGAEITARYGLANPTAAISTLRYKGYPVYANQRKVKGRNVTRFVLGKPTKRVIAAGYRALSD